MAGRKDANVEDMFQKYWQLETEQICTIKTYRGVDLSDVEVNQNILLIRDKMDQIVNVFNTTLKNVKLTRFEWAKGANKPHDPSDDEIKNAAYWVFGYRIGAANPDHKFCIVCHLDTVPATANPDKDWDPFVPTVREDVEYDGTSFTQNFLEGRGCIDDKGPAISAFIVARALAKHFDNDAYSSLTSNTQFEIIFDSSEETEMSTPEYLEDPATIQPEFGVVYDAQWNVRAEKGGERPIFQVDRTGATSGLYIHSLASSGDNSTNTIPDYATAVIKGDPELLSELSKKIKGMYENYTFDDPDYQRAPMNDPIYSDNEIPVILLTTLVQGAQHGSAPEENRAMGANPLVSLANFLAGMVDDGIFGVNEVASMVKFITWTWGTRVFGEAHESLYKFDSVFQEGNGTTYGVTKVQMTNRETDQGTKQDVVQLEIDIRYALPHHDPHFDWDGASEGLLEGGSIFQSTFGDLVERFNKENAGYPDVIFTTKTIFAPDIRLPENPDYQMAVEAYREVMGCQPPDFAIGGGTDAKGNTSLLALGPLFNNSMGPPINYHGINEAAPIADLTKSTRILFNLMLAEMTNPPIRSRHALEQRERSRNILKAMRKAGFKFSCTC